MIESLSNSKIKYAVKLKQKKYRNQTNQFLVEGDHLLEEAIKSGMFDYLFTTEVSRVTNEFSYLVSETVFTKLSDLNSKRGVIAVCNKPKLQDISKKILLLDGVQDPGNMGTLIRSAAAFGFKTIISEDSVDYFNEKVVRSSQGAVFYTNLLEEDLISFIKANKSITYFGTNVLKGQELKQIDFSGQSIAIILGNEGAGVRKDLQELVNENIKIPMLETESLNVGIAGGILMYEAFEGRR